MESFHEGDLVYFVHPEHSWVIGNVTAVGKLYTCKANDTARQVVGSVVPKVPGENITICREDIIDEDVNDLLQLSVLHDSTLLRCLFLRYMKDVIYTNIGAIVVALNPFNFKIPRYLDDKMADYLKEGDRIEVNLPHSWAQAHNTYNEMMCDGENQCILISGESGAGKTEATKIVMKYLAAIAAKRCHTEEERITGAALGTKLLACSPVLESFGNAKTVRNNNSSRFGKFIKVKFSSAGLLKGAHTTKYLLEKSRIITASPGERMYHAFYLVLRGKDREALKLDADTSYRTLTCGGKETRNPEFDTAEEYDEVCKSMTGLGMSAGEIRSVWAATAGILSFNNVEFAPSGDTCTIATPNYLDHAVSMWNIDGKKLTQELTTTTIVIRGETTVKTLNTTAAADVRDALSKALYDSAFQWLVDKCNAVCDVEADGNWIGALDIFGFEDFEINSFEQICINLTNEALQNHYNTYIFTRDLEECRAEGIDMTEVKGPDNEPCLALVAGKTGILAQLDEECAIGDRGSDKGFLENVCARHSGNPFFEKKPLAKTSFIVKHYAGNVSYEVAGWLDKNRDTLKDAIRLIMRDSQDPLIKTLIDEPMERTKGRALTVGGFFKNQVQELMHVINSTNPHWIRCVKPHPAKKPLMFSGTTTINQLIASGVLSTVKIRKAGYPIRITFDKFCKRYAIITPRPEGGDVKKWAQAILNKCGLNENKHAQIGTTKVFMKSESLPLIERERALSSVLYVMRMQSVGRGYLGRLAGYRILYERNREAIEARKREQEAQRLFRSLRSSLFENEMENRRRNQNDFTVELAHMREKMLSLMKEVLANEACLREERERIAKEAEMRRILLVKEKSAVCIQRHVRGHLSRQSFVRRQMECLRCHAEKSLDESFNEYRRSLRVLQEELSRGDLVITAHNRSIREMETRAAAKQREANIFRRREAQEMARVERELVLFETVRETQLRNMELRRQEKRRELEKVQEDARSKQKEWYEKHQQQVRERWTREERARVIAESLPNRRAALGSRIHPSGGPTTNNGLTLLATTEDTVLPEDEDAMEEERFARFRQVWKEREEWVVNRDRILASDIEKMQRVQRSNLLIDELKHSSRSRLVHNNPLRHMTSTLNHRQKQLEEEYRDFIHPLYASMDSSFS